MAYTDTSPAITTPEQVLEGLAGARDQMRRIERANVLLAVEWAKQHPAEGAPSVGAVEVGSPPRYASGQGQWAELAAMGCLYIDDRFVPEFAIAAGLTEHSARKLLRESLMLVHLLPLVWYRVLHGALEVWRARALAADCWGLSHEAIRFIDERMSTRTARLTPTARERVVEEARRRFMDASDSQARREAQDSRCVEIDFAQERHGVVPIFGALDLADALALEAALKTGAQGLRDLGAQESVEVRRAWALGDLARAATGQGMLEPAPQGPVPWLSAASAGEPAEAGGRPFWNGKGATPPQVKLFIHLKESDPEFVSVEGSGLQGARTFRAQEFKEWFTRPTMAGGFIPPVTIRSVIGLEDFEATGSYSPTDRIRDHVQLTHTSCVFPFCTAVAWKCDADHNEPWKPGGTGGATCTCNLANLCRRHHRLKTHSDQHRANDPPEGEHAIWVYAHLGGGDFYWRGPKGLAFIRTARGTYEVDGDGATGAPVYTSARLTTDERLWRAEETITEMLGHALEAAQVRRLTQPQGLEKETMEFHAWNKRTIGGGGEAA